MFGEDVAALVPALAHGLGSDPQSFKTHRVSGEAPWLDWQALKSFASAESTLVPVESLQQLQPKIPTPNKR